MQDMLKDLADMRAKASLAAEMGKALLETNVNLQSEKVTLREQAEAAQRRLDATSRQVTSLLHDNEDLRTRMASLVAHCEQLEHSNTAMARALEKPPVDAQQQQLQKRAAVEQNSRDTEKLLVLLAEEEDKNAELSQALERFRRECERHKERETQLEEEVEVRQETIRDMQEKLREKESLEQNCEALQKSNEGLAASLLALEQMHARSEEWQAVSSMLLSQPLDNEQLGKEVQSLQSSLPAIAAANCADAREMTLFLQEHLPQQHRWLLAAAAWKRECAAKKDEAEGLRRETARLRTELEIAAEAGSQTAQDTPAQPMESLADMLEEGEMAALREEMREASERWDAERKQLLELVKPFRSNLAELQQKQQALHVAHETIAKLNEQLRSRAPPETAQRVVQLEDELAAQTILIEEGRRKLVEAMLDKNNLMNAMRRIEKTMQQHSGEPEDRRQSVGAPHLAVAQAKMALQSKAASMADFGAWLPPSSSATEERRVVDRVVALERKLKDATFQSERYQHLFRVARQQTEQIEAECARLRAAEAPDLRTELFYALSLSVKLAVAARGVAVSKGVTELYDIMQQEQWPVQEWPSRIMDFFGADDAFQQPQAAAQEVAQPQSLAPPPPARKWGLRKAK